MKHSNEILPLSIFFLCLTISFVHQLSQQNKEMANLLKPSQPSDLEEVSGEGALEYYAKHTAQIEVKTLWSLTHFVISIIRVTSRVCFSDCPSRSHDGTNRVPSAQHL